MPAIESFSPATSTTALVPVTAYHNSLVPTQHQGFSILDKEFEKLSDVVYRYEQDAKGYDRRARRSERRLSRDNDESRSIDPYGVRDKTDEIEEGHKGLKAAAFKGSLLIFGFVLLLLFGIVIIYTDYAMLFEFFMKGYMNAYDEFQSDMQGLVALLGMQALIAAGALHLAFHSAKTRKIMTGVLGVLVLVYLTGIVVHRGALEIAKASASAATNPFSWNPLPQQNVAELPLWETAAIFALGIPYLVLPITAALIAWLAFTSLQDGLQARSNWREFKADYDSWEGDVNARETSQAQADRLRQEAPIRLKKPLMDLTDTRLKMTDVLDEWLVKSRMFGAKPVGKGFIPGTTIPEATDPEYVARKVLEARAILETYVDRTFEAWRQSRRLTFENIEGN